MTATSRIDLWAPSHNAIVLWQGDSTVATEKLVCPTEEKAEGRKCQSTNERLVPSLFFKNNGLAEVNYK